MLNCLKVSNFGLDSGNFVSNLQGNFLKFLLISDNETDALNNNEECGKDMSFGPMTLTSSSTLGRRIRIKVFKIHGQVQTRLSPAVPICL